MSPEEFPFLIAAYEDKSYVLHALQKLQKAGFRDEQIDVFMHSGRLIPTHIINDLVNIGVPEEQAVTCENQLQAGRILVLVRHEGRVQEAFLSLFEVTITGVSVSQQKQPPHQPGAAQASPESIPADEAATDEAEAMTSDEAESLRKLLRRAGLDHLL